jgi:hypothetical protein
MAISSEFLVQLSGRTYPLYAGILGEAHERGLQAIETQLIQAPVEENGQTAIVKAIVRMKDGGVFDGYGDASPKNVNPRIATALLRMAETRAKGRALRDAINCGMTMLEELPDLDAAGSEEPVGAVRSASVPAAAPAREGYCSAPGCGVQLTKGQQEVSTRNYGAALCPAHQRTAKAA